jgi:hypothetical protein
MKGSIVTDRKMPQRLDLGRPSSATMAFPMGNLRDAIENPSKFNPRGQRTVMGFILPSWQRGLVWTDAQKIAFIESAWRGIPLGTYTYNQASIGSPLDNLLIDGQQRMSAIEDYLGDRFPIFGCKWSELTDADRREWKLTVIFANYMTTSEDEDFLKSYYDLMNFGGTAHKETERATSQV